LHIVLALAFPLVGLLVLPAMLLPALLLVLVDRLLLVCVCGED
jgi:hypothetical protein